MKKDVFIEMTVKEKRGELRKAQLEFENYWRRHKDDDEFEKCAMVMLVEMKKLKDELRFIEFTDWDFDEI